MVVDGVVETDSDGFTVLDGIDTGSEGPADGAQGSIEGTGLIRGAVEGEGLPPFPPCPPIRVII